MWEEKVNRLARHGDDYKLSEALKKVALKNILVGKIKDNFELWESDRMPFEEILRRVKDQARAKKLEKDAQRGRSGISLGVSQAHGNRPAQEYETWGTPTSAQSSGGEEPQELNSAQDGKGKGGKAKGKGKDGKGKGKGDGKKGGGKKGSEPPKGGCFICGGKHWASECAQNALKKRGWSAQSRRARATPRGGDETMLHDELCSQNRRG